MQEMVANGITPFYWSSNGTAEVDFVFKYGSDVYPLEAKAEENLQSKSLKVYAEKFKPSVSLRTSMKDYRDEGWLINIPLYAIGTNFLDLNYSRLKSRDSCFKDIATSVSTGVTSRRSDGSVLYRLRRRFLYS
jgi:hypothetical protein